MKPGLYRPISRQSVRRDGAWTRFRQIPILVKHPDRTEAVPIEIDDRILYRSFDD
jgi:hypothetical protein